MDTIPASLAPHPSPRSSRTSSIALDVLWPKTVATAARSDPPPCVLSAVCRGAFLPRPWWEHTILVSGATSAYACSTLRSFPYSRLTFRASSLRRTGSLTKTFCTVTVVPTARATTPRDRTFPSASYSTLVPASSSAVRVATERSLSAQSDESASPLNPKDASPSRSPKSRILDVAYFLVIIARSSDLTPHPLSTTSTDSCP